MNDGYKYYAFISYKHKGKDEKKAYWLLRKLQNYKFPSNIKDRADLPKEIRHIFIDKYELAGGVLSEEIKQALLVSEHLIVICSPRSAQSQWVNDEVKFFIDKKRAKKIIPFIIGGTPYSDNPMDECFPPELLRLHRNEELHAINTNELGRNVAALKVISRMFGLDFNQLWSLVERKRRRNIFLFILLAILFGLGSLAVAYRILRQNHTITEQNERITLQNEVILKKNSRLINDSVFMAAQMDSIKRKDALIVLQQDSINNTNVSLELANRNLVFERNNLKIANWQMMENLSLVVADEARSLIEEGDSYTAQRLLLEVMPKDVENPDKPCTIEAEKYLRQAEQSNSAILREHRSWVCSAVFSPDGKRIVSVSQDYTIRIWDAESGELLKTIDISYSLPRYALFSPDGKRIASISSTGMIMLDAETGNRISGFDNKGSFNTFDFSPDGERVATASIRDNYIRILDAETGNEIRTLKGHNDFVRFVSFSPFPKHGIMGAASNPMWKWTERTEKEIRNLQGRNPDNDPVVTKGGLVVSASNDGTVRLWNEEKEDAIHIIRAHSSWVNSAVFSPDRKFVVSASNDGFVKILDVASGMEVETLKGHTRGVNYAAFSPDGKLIVSASDDETVRVWDVRTGKPLFVLEGHSDAVGFATFSPDGKRVVSASNDGTIRIWSLDTRKYSRSFQNLYVNSAFFCPDGKHIVTSSSDKFVRIWNAETGAVIQTFKCHTGRVIFAVYSPDGKRVASTSEDRTIRIWDVETNNELRVLDGHFGYVNSACFSPDGKRFVSASNDSTVRIWNVETGTRIRTFKGHTSMVNYAGFSPDGRFVVSTSQGEQVIVWDASTGAIIQTLKGRGVAFFSPDGKHILSVSRDGSKIWDVETGELINESILPANFATYSPNGKYIALASGHNIVIMDSILKNEIQTLVGHVSHIKTIDYSKDGRHIVSASDNGTILVWDFQPLQDLIDKTRERFKNRPLTSEERRMYYLE